MPNAKAPRIPFSLSGWLTFSVLLVSTLAVIVTLVVPEEVHAAQAAEVSSPTTSEPIGYESSVTEEDAEGNRWVITSVSDGDIHVIVATPFDEFGEPGNPCLLGVEDGDGAAQDGLEGWTGFSPCPSGVDALDSTPLSTGSIGGTLSQPSIPGSERLTGDGECASGNPLADWPDPNGPLAPYLPKPNHQDELALLEPLGEVAEEAVELGVKAAGFARIAATLGVIGVVEAVHTTLSFQSTTIHDIGPGEPSIKRGTQDANGRHRADFVPEPPAPVDPDGQDPDDGTDPDDDDAPGTGGSGATESGGTPGGVGDCLDDECNRVSLSGVEGLSESSRGSELSRCSTLSDQLVAANGCWAQVVNPAPVASANDGDPQTPSLHESDQCRIQADIGARPSTGTAQVLDCALSAVTDPGDGDPDDDDYQPCEAPVEDGPVVETICDAVRNPGFLQTATEIDPCNGLYPEVDWGNPDPDGPGPDTPLPEHGAGFGAESSLDSVPGSNDYSQPAQPAGPVASPPSGGTSDSPTSEPVVLDTVPAPVAPTPEPVVLDTVPAPVAPTPEPVVLDTVPAPVAPTPEPVVLDTVPAPVAPTPEPVVLDTVPAPVAPASDAGASPMPTATPEPESPGTEAGPVAVAPDTPIGTPVPGLDADDPALPVDMPGEEIVLVPGFSLIDCVLCLLVPTPTPEPVALR